MSKIEIKRNKLVGMNAKILIMGTIVYALLLVALATVQAGVIDVGASLESLEASSNISTSRSTFTPTLESRRVVTTTPTLSQNRSMSTLEPGSTVTPAQSQNRSMPTSEPGPTVTPTPAQSQNPSMSTSEPGPTVTPAQSQNRSTPTPEPGQTVTPTPTPIQRLIQKPITVAHTQPTAFLEEEAGIVAYTNTGQPIDLSKVKNIFKTVDKETDTYLIGTIIDMQAFVHVDGGIAVYYLKDEQIGKIVDPEGYGEKIISTKLERELARICDAAEVGLPYVKHYNFKYPNANKLRIITESVTNVKGYDSNTFDMKIPGDFTVYERSWLHYQYWEYEPESYMIYNLKSEIEIDDDTINSMPQHTATKYGQITPSHLLPDIFHTVGLYVSNYHPSGFRWIGDDKGFIAIIIIYQEPAISSPSSRIIQRDADSMVTLDLEPFSLAAQEASTAMPDQISRPVVVPTTSEPEEPYVHLYGHKTDVMVGEEAKLSLSAVNSIVNPKMTLQLILRVPSGMGIGSTEFMESGTGMYTATYTIEPGKERHIGVQIKTNQVGDFNVEGDICYYFGEDKSSAKYKRVTLPIMVNQLNTPVETAHRSKQTETPGFEIIFTIVALFAVAYLVGRKN